MATIDIELSVAGCRNAIRELNEYRREVRRRLDEVCRQLAEIGAAEAQNNLYFADGNDDAIISTAKTQNGYKVVMDGSDVYFIEFGTGNAVNVHGNPTTAVEVWSGSYSFENAQQYYIKGYWYYNGERYTETPAYMPLYHAARAMRDAVNRTVQEVFRDL